MGQKQPVSNQTTHNLILFIDTNNTNKATDLLKVPLPAAILRAIQTSSILKSQAQTPPRCADRPRATTTVCAEYYSGWEQTPISFQTTSHP